MPQWPPLTLNDEQPARVYLSLYLNGPDDLRNAIALDDVELVWEGITEVLRIHLTPEHLAILSQAPLITTPE